MAAFHIERTCRDEPLEVVPIGQDSRFHLPATGPIPTSSATFCRGTHPACQGFASWQTSWFATDMESRFKLHDEGAGHQTADHSASAWCNRWITIS